MGIKQEEPQEDGKKDKALERRERKEEREETGQSETGSCLYHAVPHGTLSVLPSLGHVLGAGGPKTGW